MATCSRAGSSKFKEREMVTKGGHLRLAPILTASEQPQYQEHREIEGGQIIDQFVTQNFEL